MNRLLSILAIVLLISLSDGKTLIVDSAGSGNSKTISGAIIMASPGDEILIKPGDYASVAINRSVSISGIGTARILAKNGNALLITAPGCRISNLSIVGAKSGIVLKSSDNLLARCTIQGGSTGIAISGSNNTIRESQISSSLGIGLTGSGCRIFGNTFNGDVGLNMTNSSQNEIKDCRFLSVTGMEIVFSDGNVIENNSLSGMRFGLALSGSKGNSIYNNYLSGSYVSGIDAVESGGNGISNNRIQGGKLGISLRRSGGNHLINNTCLENERAGIYADSSFQNEITENNLSGNGNGILIANSRGNLLWANNASVNTYGISLRGSVENILRNNSLNANTYNLRIDSGEVSSAAIAQSSQDFFDQDIDGSNLVNGKPVFYLVDANNVEVPPGSGFVGLIKCMNMMVSNQTISNNSAGILIVNSTGCRIKDNNFSHNEAGVYLLNSETLSLWNCTEDGCKTGLLASGSKNGLIEKNIASNCSDNGYRIDDAQNITIKSSNALSNKVGISILDSRLCNLLDCVSEKNKGTGIMLSSTHKCILRTNVVSSNDRGIALLGSNACILSNNNASGNRQDGLALEQLSGADLIGNIAIRNNQGIFVQSSKDLAVKNNILNENNHYGLRMSSSSDSNITDNRFIMNGISGVNLVDCKGNILYHNIFIGNGVQNAADNGNNKWDAGPEIGGNYWDDHSVSGNPGSTPRNVPSGGLDRYPFQNPNGWR